VYIGQSRNPQDEGRNPAPGFTVPFVKGVEGLSYIRVPAVSTQTEARPSTKRDHDCSSGAARPLATLGAGSGLEQKAGFGSGFKPDQRHLDRL
jgi:hypothetical protein